MRSNIVGLLPLVVLVAVLGLAGCSGGPAACPDPNIECGEVCVAAEVDRANCGACGNSCGNLQCINGTCGCPEGQDNCNGRCVNLQLDPRNCGACGTTCEATQICSQGVCGCAGPDCTCPGTVCDDTCVDTDTDALNCGGCGNACGEGLLCQGGSCVAG